MSWILFAVQTKNSVDAYIKYENERSAQFRCWIYWTNNQTGQEHLRPKLTGVRKTGLVKCQIALPFFLAALVGFPAYLVRGSWIQTFIEWLILWPLWAWAISFRFRREQRKANEKIYDREVASRAAAFRAGRDLAM